MTNLLEKDKSNLENHVTDFILDERTLNRRILDCNSVNALEEFNKIKSAKNNNHDIKIIKLDEGMLWHIRLGHPSLNYLKQLKKSEQSLYNVTFKENILDWETCILAKMEKLPFKESRLIADRPLHTIHIDTMGQFKINSFPGACKYIIVFLDDFSRFAKIYAIKNKNEAANCLERFITTVRNLLGKNEKVCYIRTDNAKEFTGGDFVDVMHKDKLNAKINTHMNKIRRFGCLAYVRLPISENKFSERAVRTILVGYSRTGYVLWEPTSGKFLNSMSGLMKN